MARVPSSTAEPVRHRLAGALAALALLVAAAGAGAQESGETADNGHQLCNRSGYILEAALAIETQGASATQGWFRVLPGSCITLLEGAAAGERYFLHVRTPAFYGEQSELGEVSRMFCVREGDFLLAGAGRCNEEGGTLAAFGEVGGEQRISKLTEARDMDAASARITAIQRLLALSGFAPGEEEGKAGKGTAAALDAFARARGEPRFAGKAIIDGTEGQGADEALFSALYEAASTAMQDAGLTLCNATAEAMMAAVATQGGKAVTSRGWYAVAPGSCKKVIARPLDEGPVWLRAEAVDAEGNTLVSDGRPLIWGGEKALCTKASQFAITESDDCAASGGKKAGFFRVEPAGAGGVTVRLSPENRQSDENSR